MRLKEVAVKNAQAREKPYRISDGNGLFLQVRTNGTKLWHFRFKLNGTEKLLSLGIYPQISLKSAREQRDRARGMLQQGLDPAGEKQSARRAVRLQAGNSFRAIALEWHSTRAAIWTPKHSTRMLKKLEKEIFPDLGAKAITVIKPTDLLMTLRKMEARGIVHSAHRMHQIAGQIFRYAVATGRAERDISSDLRGALRPMKKTVHQAHFSANELPEFMERLGHYDGELQTRNAVELLMLTFVRTGELRGAKKTEFDLEAGEWRIPAERMKMRLPHVVPLSKQVVRIFKKQIMLSGNSEYMFPNRNRPWTFMSENAALYALYRMGYHGRATGHGFRATASTILHENGFNSEIIERQLAHLDRNQVRSSYNHASYMAERRKMMQWWADYLDKAARQ